MSTVLMWQELRIGVARDPDARCVVRSAAGSPVEGCGDILDGDLGEGRGVALLAHQRRNLAHQALHQVPDGHAAGDGVRVDDDVRRDALARERHVLLRVGDADGALLPVPGRELVAHLRDPDGPHLCTAAEEWPSPSLQKRPNESSTAGEGGPKQEVGC